MQSEVGHFVAASSEVVFELDIGRDLLFWCHSDRCFVVLLIQLLLPLAYHGLIHGTIPVEMLRFQVAELLQYQKQPAMAEACQHAVLARPSVHSMP